VVKIDGGVDWNKGLVRRIAARSGVDRDVVRVVFKATFEEISRSLVLGRAVGIRCFGKFTPVRRRGRRMRSNLDGNVVEMPDRFVVRYKPSDYLLRKINHQFIGRSVQ